MWTQGGESLWLPMKHGSLSMFLSSLGERVKAMYSMLLLSLKDSLQVPVADKVSVAVVVLGVARHVRCLRRFFRRLLCSLSLLV